MSYIQFESGREIDAQRDAVRSAREKILVDAEKKYRSKEAQAEKARLRGDDKWMLPSVEAKLSKEKSKKKKKKDKKEKKVKKAKKSKKKTRKSNSSSSSSSDTSDNEEMQWIEKTSEVANKASILSSTTEPEKPLQRDEWMSLSGSFLCSSRDKKSKKDNDEKQGSSILDKPGTSGRELNPHWKNNGNGLPEEENITKKSNVQIMNADWLKKSLQRAQEQALAEGKSLEEIAAERWGSLEIIQSRIEEAEKQSRYSNVSRNNSYDARSKIHGRKSDNRKHDRDRGRSRSRSRDRSKHNYDNYKYDFNSKKKMAFKKPDEDNHTSNSYSRQSSSAKSWRKPEANEKITQQQQQEQLRTIESEQRKRKSTSDSESSESEEKSETSIKILTDDELNKLGARLVKAEIMGDTELTKKLKIEMENAREVRKNNPKPVESRKRETEKNIILTTTNSRGLARPVQPRSRYEEPQGGRRKNKKTDTHEGGERVRYFADDDKFSLQSMFQREKGSSTNNDDAVFVKMASKSMDMDELFEERITRGDSDAKQDHKDKMRAIKEHQKMQKSLDSCRWCVDSDVMQKHLIVAMGSKVYLSLPWHVSLTSGHCIIAPIHHVPCQTQLDEDVWEEITAFKKALTKMFMDNNECPVFFEVAMGQYKFPHMQLECVALPEDVGSMAPMYFKKALLECETEWSTNKKVVDLSQKDVRQAIPKGLPYFAVNFGNHGGFAHVIEDERMFPRNFAQEIIGGMLDLDSNMWRKPRREDFDHQKQKVLLFADKWKKYDVTSNNID